jgi:hypothetical protein
MNLPELIENLSLDLEDLNRTAINQVINQVYSCEDLINLCEIFLRGIGKQHQVNGHVISTLWGIQDYYRQYQDLTPKQRVYVIQNILNNWNQVGLDMRCQLGL